MGATALGILGLVLFAAFVVWLATRYAKQAGGSRALVKVLEAGRKIQKAAEIILHGPRRHGRDLVDRMRRKRRGRSR